MDSWLLANFKLLKLGILFSPFFFIVSLAHVSAYMLIKVIFYWFPCERIYWNFSTCCDSPLNVLPLKKQAHKQKNWCHSRSAFGLFKNLMNQTANVFLEHRTGRGGNATFTLNQDLEFKRSGLRLWTIWEWLYSAGGDYQLMFDECQTRLIGKVVFFFSLSLSPDGNLHL